MRLVSWNVNGIRAVIRAGALRWLTDDPADMVCLQETRAQPEQLAGVESELPGYHVFWHSAHQKGYSGVATLCRTPPAAVTFGFGLPHFDVEGRVLMTQHPGFSLLNVYFPSGRRGQERVAYKIEFYDALLEFCSSLRTQGRRLIVCGDFNTAHEPIDLARPKENRKTSGFLPEEREALDRWLSRGFVDVFRSIYPGRVAYTWWTSLFDARSRNIGWRIDYFLVSEELRPHVRDTVIRQEIMGSDHCPVELRLDLEQPPPG